MGHALRIAGFLSSLFGAVLGFSRDGKAQTDVDLTLVLTVDVSLSMDLEEQQLQREGYVSAFRDPVVWNAIRSGLLGRIAVSYVEWAGGEIQRTVVPWTLIDSPQAAQAFSEALAAQPISRHRRTSISGALAYGAKALDAAPYRAARRVIDVSGDGPNNSGRPVQEARDLVLGQGIVINGLPLLLKSGGAYSGFDIPNLDAYYAACVIGGPGSFSLPVRDKSEFATAIRKKLILEISGLTPEPQPRVIRAQAATRQPVVDCLVGEKRWQEYMFDRFQ